MSGDSPTVRAQRPDPPRPRAPRIPIWALGALCGLDCAGRSSDGASAFQPAITMNRLRAEVDPHICAQWSPEVQEWGGPLFDEQCPRPATSTELARAVQGAVARVRPMIMLSEDAGQRFAAAVRGQPASAQATADALARAAFWRDPQLSRAMALALHEALRARRWKCDDCPPPAAATRLTLPWSTFLPYLDAYIHPHDGEGGKIEVHTCSAVNGTAALAPDPRLLHAGILTALDFAMDEAMAREIHTIAADSRSASDAAAALMALLDSPPGRAHACAALAKLEWFTGLRIDECP